MSEKVSIELSVEQAGAVRGWLENNKGIVQNEEGLKALEKASERASKKSKSMWEGVGAAALKTATAVMSVTKAMELFQKEIEAHERRNENAKNQQLELGPTQRRAYDALP